MEGIVQFTYLQLGIILLIYLAIVMYIGYRANRARIDLSEQDFFVTKWSTGWVGISFSIAATFASGAYVMGTMGAFYNDPVSTTGYTAGVLFAPFMLWMLGRRIWLLGRKYGYSTFTDYIGDFYKSDKLRVTVSSLVVLLFAPYFAVNLVAPALLLESLTGGQIPYTVGVLAMAIIAVGYTLLGGMRGVIWTDILQASLMYVMFLIAVPIAIMSAGGFSNIVQTIPAEKILYPNTTSNWMLVFSWFVIVGFMQTGNPDRAFRLLTAKNINIIKQAAIASAVLLGSWALIPMLIGYAFNISMPGISPTDMIMPVALSAYAPWLMSLFLIAVFAGGMSTVDSGMIACTSMVVKDIYRKAINPKATERQVFTLSRWMVVFFGFFAIFVALARPPYLWLLVGAAAGVAMQWTPAMLFGLYWKRANTPAAWAGLMSGIIVTALFQYIIPCPWPGPAGPAIIGFAFNIPLYVIVALLTPPMSKEHLDEYQGIFKKCSETA